MRQYKSFRELKSRSREGLLGRYVTLFTAMVVIAVPSSLGAFFLLYFSDMDNLRSILLYFFVFLIVALLLSVFTTGLQYLYLCIARQQRAHFTGIFYAFRHHPDKVIILSLLLVILATACFLPAALAIGFTALIPFFAVAAVPAILFGVIIFTLLNLSCSMVFFLYVDHPERSCLELLSDSFRLTAGHKKRLFLLQLSFLGWQLLLFFSTFGAFWISPYMKVTYASFYLDLLGELDPPPEVIDPDPFGNTGTAGYII